MLSRMLSITVALGKRLDDLGVVWLVGGSVASSLLGVFRTTQDVDLVADLRLPHVRPLVAALEADFYISEEAVRDAIRRRASFNVIELTDMVKVDIFVPRWDALSRAELSRRCFIELEGGVSLPVASREDIILQKLEWYRKGERVSERQWRDVAGVIQTSRGRLDLDYLQGVAAEAGLAELLKAALDEQGG